MWEIARRLDCAPADAQRAIAAGLLPPAGCTEAELIAALDGLDADARAAQGKLGRLGFAVEGDRR